MTEEVLWCNALKPNVTIYVGGCARSFILTTSGGTSVGNCINIPCNYWLRYVASWVISGMRSKIPRNRQIWISSNKIMKCWWNCSALAMKQTFLLMDQWKKSYFHDDKPFKYWCMFPCEQTNLLGMLAVSKDVILPCFETSHFYNVKYSAVLGIGDKDHIYIYVFWDIFPFI